MGGNRLGPELVGYMGEGANRHGPKTFFTVLTITAVFCI